MSALLKSKPTLIVAFLLSLPILLPLYNPSMELGSVGAIIGLMGITISPLILFGTLILLILKTGK